MDYRRQAPPTLPLLQLSALPKSRIECLIRKTIYNLVEKDGETTWTPIGVPWINRDGSLTCNLDVMPKEGKLHIRDPKPRRID